MKGLLVLAIILSAIVIFIHWKRKRDNKKTLIAAASLVFVLSLGFMGFITRSVMPIFLLHIILVISAWACIFWYILKDKYYWWVIASPIVSICLFLVMELLTGSGSESAIIS